MTIEWNVDANIGKIDSLMIDDKTSTIEQEGEHVTFVFWKKT